MIYKLLIILYCLSCTGMKAFSQERFTIEKVEVDKLKDYQLQKLKQEIEKLRSENSIDPIFRIVPTYGGFLTAIIGIFVAFSSVVKYLKEKRSETEQKILENKFRVEAKFDAIINNLGSTSHSKQSIATVSLLTYLKPEYKEFHYQVYLILLAKLKTNPSENVISLMVKTFEKALRLNLESIQSQKVKNISISQDHPGLDLSRANLYRIDLQGLNLENVDFAFSNLRYANLENCNLRRAKGIQTDLSGARISRANITEGRFNQAIFKNAQFHESILVSAKLKNTNLRGAEFQQAKLQDAHLDDAEIYGAKFEYANINNTYLRKIKCGESDLKSILKSKDFSWKKAHFDKEINEKLIHLSSK